MTGGAAALEGPAAVEALGEPAAAAVAAVFGATGGWVFLKASAAPTCQQSCHGHSTALVL